MHLKLLINKTRWNSNALDSLKITIKSEFSFKMKALKEKEYYCDAANLPNSRDFTFFFIIQKKFLIVPVDKASNIFSFILKVSLSKDIGGYWSN